MEIGSEFWKRKKPKLYIQDNEEVFLSGRTALDIIVQDAVESHGIKSALLPSYCCHTMIEPFLINNIYVRFYDIYVDNGGKLRAFLPLPYDNEILYIMKYFGDTDLIYEGPGCSLNGWCTSVEDMTHSCFNGSYNTDAEYWYTSYRKWFAIDGIAIAGKRSGSLRAGRKGRNITYCQLRNKAFDMKDCYMEDKPIGKQDFLNVFSEAEQLLSTDYREYGARPDSVAELCGFLNSSEQIKKTRRRNAEILQWGIKDIPGIKVFVDFKDPEKCPLFVPIIVKDSKRDDLRKYLTDKDIYCPIHWPLSENHIGLSGRAIEIYESELSLVCDQRYSTEDMTRIVKNVTEFFEES